MSNEQWLEDGDCWECRRAKYCHTPCKKINRCYKEASETQSLLKLD